MLEKIDLSKKVDKKTYRRVMDEAEEKLGLLQRECKDAGIPVILVFEGMGAAGKGVQINRLIQALEFTLTGLRGYKEAIITQGGISVKDVNPSTMESKKIQGLYFAGEILDLDAVTGGFNLQIAWSTGWAAGKAASS